MRIRSLPLLIALLAGSAGATDVTAGWAAVDDGELEQVRGGFALGDGLLVSLGVERLVSINGTVVASTHFSIPDMTQLSAAEAAMASDALAAVVVQNGAGNLVAPLATQGLGALLIQNSVNDQAIRSQTTISTTVSNLAMLKAANFESSLRDALSAAVVK
ncbi:hypothetical protein GTP56_20010 [Duganella sp. FT134W]|uniref:Uncharacterized protein n=1 Tax=Duganella margarita TaxID=2692170 RepID=A0A7X4H465_9BURK|nr:hypothetical protein [Duganella margarita]MYM74461.1 hypothetical protein [Duganella margarita]